MTLRLATVGFSLAALTILVFGPGLSGPFLFDDYANLVNNEWITPNQATPLDLRAAALSSNAGPLGRPIAMATFALQSWAFGDVSAVASKSLNLFIHLLTALAIFLLCQELVRAPHLRLSAAAIKWAPPICAALWCLSPLQVSTVLYPIQRMAQFAALFTFLALYCYALFRRRWCETPVTADAFLSCFLWLFLLTTAAVFSKENGLLTPWLILVTELVFFRGRFAGRHYKVLSRLTAALFVLSVLLVLGLIALKFAWISSGYGMRDFTLQERVLTQARVLWHYASWFCLPDVSALGLFHDDIAVSRSMDDPPMTRVAVLALLAAVAAAAACLRKVPEFSFAVLFFLVAHSLESSVLALEMVFEHRNYIPSFGLAFMMSIFLLRLCDAMLSQHIKPLVARLPLFACIAIFAAASALRAGTWTSELSITGAAIERHPESARSAFAYANALLRASGANGDSTDESAYIAVARHELERSVQRDALDIPALVMMIIIDQQVYPEIGSADRWYAQLQEAVDNRTLSASDLRAVSALVKCVSDGDCVLERESFARMLDTFEKRFARGWSLASVRMQYAGFLDDNPQRKLERLRATVRQYPDLLQTRYDLLEAELSNGQRNSARFTALELLAADRDRTQLPAVRDLFSALPPAVPGP